MARQCRGAVTATARCSLSHHPSSFDVRLAAVSAIPPDTGQPGPLHAQAIRSLLVDGEMCLLELGSEKSRTAPEAVFRMVTTPQEGESSQLSINTAGIDNHLPALSETLVQPNGAGVNLEEILSMLNSLTEELRNISLESRAAVTNFSASHSLTPTREARLSFQKNRTTHPTVKLNVGGKVFRVTWSLLLQVANVC